MNNIYSFLSQAKAELREIVNECTNDCTNCEIYTRCEELCYLQDPQELLNFIEREEDKIRTLLEMEEQL